MGLGSAFPRPSGRPARVSHPCLPNSSVETTAGNAEKATSIPAAFLLRSDETCLPVRRTSPKNILGELAICGRRILGSGPRDAASLCRAGCCVECIRVGCNPTRRAEDIFRKRIMLNGLTPKHFPQSRPKRAGGFGQTNPVGTTPHNRPTAPQSPAAICLPPAGRDVCTGSAPEPRPGATRGPCSPSSFQSFLRRLPSGYGFDASDCRH
jgi:hypothetical protein